MVSSGIAVAGRSPLEQIRQAEAEVTRRVAAARKGAEAALKEAQAQAADLKRQARDLGHREGQEQYQEIRFRAEEEARTLIAQAHSQAEDLCRKGEPSMDAAVRWALAIVIGWNEGLDKA